MGTDTLEHSRVAQPASLVELRAGELHLALSPEVGGSIAAFSRRWREGQAMRECHWLRPASEQSLAQRDPLGMAGFVLLPFCNRIRNGRASFEGREIRFPPNHPDGHSPHPLHGIGWQRPWRLESAGTARAVLTLDVAATPAWPWRFSARQTFELQADELRVSLALTNEDGAAMPAGIGHHPYFPRGPGTRLQTLARAMWETDREVMPTRLGGADVVRKLRRGALLTGLHTDNNFTGWSRQARIDWPADSHGPARHLLLQAQPPLDYFVLYCPTGQDAFCAEPVSQCTDWLNLLDRYGHEALGGARLQPGRALVAQFSLAPRWG